MRVSGHSNALIDMNGTVSRLRPTTEGDGLELATVCGCPNHRPELLTFLGHLVRYLDEQIGRLTREAIAGARPQNLRGHVVCLVIGYSGQDTAQRM